MLIGAGCLLSFEYNDPSRNLQESCNSTQEYDNSSVDLFPFLLWV
uniref:Uncharacterized protein n=1 Tax=Manihot esculenta TaxID=3983 RepID=A0A199UAG5_MANES